MVDTVHVVTAFLCHRGRILLLRRSDRVGSYRGRWAAVSGYLEEPTPLAQALREIEEETGIAPAAVTLAAEGRPVAVDDETLQRCWVVHPFLFDLAAPPEIRLDWEHTAFRWASPAEFARLPTVPRLADALAACWPGALDSAADVPGE
jgi:8-oxo-dGTP pyrophosphatase MutT (NUDIX family)